MTKCLVTFYLVHSTIPNYNSVTRILAHKLGGNFESFCEVNQKFMCFSLSHAIQKGNQAGGGEEQNRARIGVHRIVKTLYWLNFCLCSEVRIVLHVHSLIFHIIWLTHFGH